MELKEFVLKVQKTVTERLGEGYQIKIQEVQKNNSVLLQGLVILSENKNVSPTIYLNSFWEAYEQGIPFAVILERLLRIYEEDTPKENIDMSFFKDFQAVKDRICYRLISAQRNRELLQKIPHLEYLDLTICFYYAYQGATLGKGSILIHNTHMEMWKTNTEELLELARCNTPRLFPWECSSMEAVLKEMMEEQSERGMEFFLEEEEQKEFFARMPLWVLSNEERVHGAACILYPELLKQIAVREGRNLFILPSSIHEVILLPDNGSEDPERLQEMITEVNATQVEPEEVLSDHLYYYDRLSEQITIV